MSFHGIAGATTRPYLWPGFPVGGHLSISTKNRWVMSLVIFVVGLMIPEVLPCLHTSRCAEPQLIREGSYNGTLANFSWIQLHAPKAVNNWPVTTATIHWGEECVVDSGGYPASAPQYLQGTARGNGVGQVSSILIFEYQLQLLD